MSHPFPANLEDIIKIQTKTARELKFWENVSPPQHVTCNVSCVTCHMSCVMCHMSHVMCHMSCVTCHFFLLLFLDSMVKLISGGSVINSVTSNWTGTNRHVSNWMRAGLSRDFLMTFSWLSHDFCMTFLWLFHDFLINFSWLSYEFLMTF